MKLLASVLALLAPTTALAQVAAGPYVTAGLGDAHFSESLRSARGSPKLSTDAGPVGTVSAGWRFGNGVRLSLEGSYQSNSVENVFTRRINGSLMPLTDVNGHVSTYSIMPSVTYAFHGPTFISPLQPYVGAGLGYGWLDLSSVQGGEPVVFHLPQNNIYAGPAIMSFRSGGAFAYQAVVGVALPLTRVHGLELTGEYRFFGMARADLPVSRVATGNNTVNGVVPSETTRTGFSAKDNILMVGVRYSFGPL